MYCVVFSPNKFFCFFNSGRSEWLKIAKFCINLLRWLTEPGKDLKIFKIVGGFRFNIEVVFESNCLIPLFVNLQPSHSISFFAK